MHLTQSLNKLEVTKCTHVDNDITHICYRVAEDCVTIAGVKTRHFYSGGQRKKEMPYESICVLQAHP